MQKKDTRRVQTIRRRIGAQVSALRAGVSQTYYYFFEDPFPFLFFLSFNPKECFFRVETYSPKERETMSFVTFRRI